VQYEGEELSENMFNTGAAPNQKASPAVEYLMSKDGGGAKRFEPLGTEYVYPRTTNKTNRDIGDILGTSPRAITKHLERVFKKLGVEMRTAAAAMAIERAAVLGATVRAR
jgi:Periplasmic binding protein domain/Bacterial regulatory proteins, luxR family